MDQTVLSMMINCRKSEKKLFLHIMPETIIHIGYPKTATTWFIRKFYPNIRNADTIYYDNIKFDITPGNEVFEINYEKTLPEKEKLIIVTHAFAGLVNLYWENGKYRELFLKNLKNLYPGSSIVLFIRNQFDFMASIYSSYLKKGGSYTIQELFSEKFTSDGKFFSFEYLKYDKLIKMYQEQFGKDKVHVYVYEEFLESNDTFLKDYIHLFGLDIDLNDLSFVKSNEKLRKGLISLVRATNSFIKNGAKPKYNFFNIPITYSIINDHIDKLNQFKIWGKKLDSKNMLGDELTAFVDEYYKESNHDLINSYDLQSIKRFNYPL